MRVLVVIVVVAPLDITRVYELPIRSDPFMPTSPPPRQTAQTVFVGVVIRQYSWAPVLPHRPPFAHHLCIATWSFDEGIAHFSVLRISSQLLAVTDTLLVHPSAPPAARPPAYARP